MNKTAQTELHRLFLVERLPDPLTPASSHLQIFDNYIAGTRIRLRQIRDPYSKSWTRILQQRFPFDETHGTVSKIAEMYLNDAEYAVFERFEGREIRKNRYFHEIDRVSVAFDVFLGPLWGLNTARVDFETLEALQNYSPPPSFIFEVSNDPFFAGESLVTKSFDDVRQEVDRLAKR
jgi:CYTH domain-containing protein